MDGQLKINTRLYNEKLKYDLKEAKKELDKFKSKEDRLTDKKIEIEAKIELDKKDYDRQINELLKEKEEAITLKKINGLDNTKTINNINTEFQSKIDELDSKSPYIKGMNELSIIEKQLENNKLKIEESSKKYAEVEKKVNDVINANNNLKSSLDEVPSKVNNITNSSSSLKNSVNDLEDEIDDVDDKVDKVSKNLNKHSASFIKKVGQMAMAVFGIRSAYNAVRSAVSTLSSYNKQMATDIEYIKFSLASILEPVIEKMVSLVYKLLSYANFLSQAWLKVNLFAGASADKFKKANSNAKSLSKTLASFDDNINVMGDNSSGDTNNLSPSMDLSNLENIEIPDWLVKIQEFFQPVFDFFNEVIEKYGPVAGGILIIVGALSGFLILKTIIGLITGLLNPTKSLSTNFTNFFDSLGKAIEFIAILGGLALVIESVTDLIDTFSKSGLTLNDVIGLMATIFISIIALMGSVAILGPLMTAGLVPFLGVITGICALLITMSLTMPLIANSLTLLGKLITNLMQSLLWFINNLGPSINNFVDNAMNAVTKLINFMISGIEYLVNILVVDGLNKIINGINSIGKYVGFTIPSIGEFKIKRFKPTYMATGGIIDVPKKGVALRDDIIGGEAGPEGVLPLTNDSTMERLGREIGKWVSVNVDLTGKIDKYTLFRILKKIQNNEEFNRNGG